VNGELNIKESGKSVPSLVREEVVKIRPRISILCFTLAVICLVGCKRKTEPAKADPPKGEVSLKADSNTAEPKITESTTVDIKTNEPSVSAKAEPREIVAAVNGIGILKSDYEARVERQIGPVQRQMPANFFEQYKKELGKKVLDEMIVDILLAQKAKQKDLTVTDPEIDRRINEVVQRQKMFLQDYRDMLKAKGEDFSRFRDKVRQNLQFEKLVEAEYGPIDFTDSNEAQTKRRELAGQYIQKLKSEARIT
jgi:hypothetical protein